jgi:hypothetical protein
MSIHAFRGGVRFLFACALTTALAAGPALGADLAIKDAEWSAKKGRLSVEGVGPTATRITLFDTADDSIIGSRWSKKKGDGEWKVKVKLDTVPCRIRAEADGVSIERDVKNTGEACNAPLTPVAGTDDGSTASGNGSASSGGSTASTGTLLRIEEAKWERGDSRLVVKGEGPRSTKISVANAGDGSLIGTPRSRNNRDGDWRLRAELDVPPCRVRASVDNQLVERDVKNAGSDCDNGEPPVIDPPPPTITGDSINSTSANIDLALAKVDEEPLVNPGRHTLLAANDLGMHCADLDYRVFSILPPFNVVHAQVIERNHQGRPRILDDSTVEVVYSAASSANDPALANPTAAERGEPVFKGNFWQKVDGEENPPLWYQAYAPLYFGLLTDTDLVQDKGLPVPDSMKLPGGDENCLSGYDGTNPDGPRTDCDLAQALMPGHFAPHMVNEPQHFDRFDRHFNFFNALLGGLGLGAVVEDTNWFSAEGIPIMPVDDQGRNNAFPLMRVQARDRSTGEVLASTDVVLPVASEADCQQCHARTLDCETINQAYDYGMQCSEEALDRPHPEIAGYRMPAVVSLDDNPPGDTLEQQLLNASKINILRLHDAKWATTLDEQRRVVCASCHYSPALDLAQLGPTDSPETEQTRHISMSRAMHGHHGDLMNKDGTARLFPAMPAPDDPVRDQPVSEHLDSYPLATADSGFTVEEYVLQNACYSCHPGKRTQCLRGAMAGGGVVCQDCHGDMLAVGDDFSHDFPNNPGSMDTSKRVPWAVEPGCQSCHVGDAMQQPADRTGFIYDDDGIRLLRAFRSGDPSATPIRAADSRFAENQVVNDDGQTVDLLYRLSKGHGGVMCEGCHGSTHAIWPNANPWANDNVTATQIQGHSGTITECSACHESGLGLTLDGPHGMHPVASRHWNREHEDLSEDNSAACRSCHGQDGEGTVLSRTAAERIWECKDEKGSLCSSEDQLITVPRGTVVSCTQCHENEIDHD